MKTDAVNDAPEHHCLVMSDINKSFPGVQALDNAHLAVRTGEIHGLVGENGAGKSTIIKVLAGVYGYDSGGVFINGQEITDVTPKIVHERGVRFIHQELHLVPHFTVAESVFMGQELRSRWTGIDKRGMRKQAEIFLKEALNSELDSNRLIRDLTVAERKLVQIAHALIDDQAKMVVFDEPTAPLASDEVDQVFKAIRKLKQRGISMIYVSHYLGEITEICDRVTVFRNGKNVGVLNDIGPSHADKMIEYMVGREIKELYPVKKHNIGKPRLIAQNLGDGEKFRGVNFEVGAGEIVGIAGLVGSGREELIDAIYGLRKITRGSLTFDQAQVNISSPVKAVNNGLALVPRDRRNYGLVLEMSVADNINLPSLSEVAIAGLERRQLSLQRADQQVEKLDIRPRNSKTISQNLSGGNQQKVVLARWLATQSRVFILDEPTVGVDIGSKVEIYQLIEDLAANGASVLVSSSDPGELLGLCDRLIVMLRGEVISTLDVKKLTLDSLLALTTGSDSAQGVAQLQHPSH